MSVRLLPTAHIACRNAVLWRGGDENVTEIGCYAFLLEKDGERMLIDTGIEDLSTVNRTKSSKDDWTRANEEADVRTLLARCGLKPEEITKVFLTHSHYDHLSGILHFPHAAIYMSRAEYDFLLSDSPHRPFLREQIAFLSQADLRLFDSDGPLDGGIFAMRVAGHTPGSVLYTFGDTLFTGDNVFLLKSIRENRPIGFCLNEQEAERALAICRAHKGPILTSHDKECMYV